MTDKELLRAYLTEVSKGRTIKAVAESAGLTRDAFQAKLEKWRNAGLKVPSTRELRNHTLNELRKVIDDFYAS